MPTTDRAEVNRLILQIERELVAHSSLKTLLADAAAAILRHRQELRRVRARLTRRRIVRT